jgi:hypothetical protein
MHVDVRQGLDYKHAAGGCLQVCAYTFGGEYMQDVWSGCCYCTFWRC